jgi:hypothetical protein
VEVPDLRPYADARELEVRARPRSKGAFVGGLAATGLGGGLMFIGGFLALGGGLADEKGLLIAGGVTAGIGLVAIAPGVYLMVTSGSKAEVRSAAAAGSPGIGLGGTF